MVQQQSGFGLPPHVTASPQLPFLSWFSCSSHPGYRGLARPGAATMVCESVHGKSRGPCWTTFRLRLDLCSWSKTSPTSGVPSLDAWLLATDSDVRNIRAMPQKAQRELSASVKALQVADFETDARADQSPGALRRFKNWLAECDRQAGRWTQVVPW